MDDWPSRLTFAVHCNPEILPRLVLAELSAAIHIVAGHGRDRTWVKKKYIVLVLLECRHAVKI